MVSGFGVWLVKPSKFTVTYNNPTNTNATIPTRNIQPIGDWLNACRLLKMPLRVRKVAKLHSAKVVAASRMVVFLNAPHARQDMAACGCSQ